MKTHLSASCIDLKAYENKRVLFMAGGTGGHVIPGLTVANLMRDNGAHIEWLGTTKGIESRLVPDANIKIHYISVHGLRGKGLASWVLAPFMLLKAIWESIRVIKQVQPDCVVGMGGFASGPGGVAAYILGKPVVVHEQNAVAGTTNRLLSKIASRVLQAFDGAFKEKSKAITTGNPVRSTITNARASKDEDDCKLRVLVLGGSLGAKPLNDLLPKAFSSLIQNKVDLDIWHQCGKTHIDSVSNLYASEGIDAKVDAFISSMNDAYAWADIVICRAGALTVAEVACAGKCAVFIPLPHAIDNHQYYNALSLVEKNAGFMLEQHEMTEGKVKTLILRFIKNTQLIEETANKARAVAQINATEIIAQSCLEVIHDR